jgi:hypothetical protein
MKKWKENEKSTKVVIPKLFPPSEDEKDKKICPSKERQVCCCKISLRLFQNIRKYFEDVRISIFFNFPVVLFS